MRHDYVKLKITVCCYYIIRSASEYWKLYTVWETKERFIHTYTFDVSVQKTMQHVVGLKFNLSAKFGGHIF